MADERLYAHELEPHPVGPEPVERLARYHLARAQGFSAMFQADQGMGSAARFLAEAHLAVLYQALSSGMSGQAASDWAYEALTTNEDEVGSLVWELCSARALDPKQIRAYAGREQRARDEEALVERVAQALAIVEWGEDPPSGWEAHYRRLAAAAITAAATFEAGA